MFNAAGEPHANTLGLTDIEVVGSLTYTGGPRADNISFQGTTTRVDRNVTIALGAQLGAESSVVNQVAAAGNVIGGRVRVTGGLLGDEAIFLSGTVNGAVSLNLGGGERGVGERLVQRPVIRLHRRGRGGHDRVHPADRVGPRPLLGPAGGRERRGAVREPERPTRRRPSSTSGPGRTRSPGRSTSPARSSTCREGGAGAAAGTEDALWPARHSTGLVFTVAFHPDARADYEIVRDLDFAPRTFGSLTVMKRSNSLTAIDLLGF